MPKTTKKTGGASKITIPAIQKKRFALTLIGDSDLLVHHWSRKAREEMLRKQMGLPAPPKEKKDPWMDFCNSMYWMSPMPGRPTWADLDKAVFGFPTVAFKAAAIRGCKQTDSVAMTDAMAAFHVLGELTVIRGFPYMREDMVRLNGTTADLRYRGAFFPWSVTIEIEQNSRFFTSEQIVNLFNVGGFGSGVGEWRAMKRGNYGRFHVATAAEAKTVRRARAAKRPKDGKLYNEGMVWSPNLWPEGAEIVSAA